jgi:hypothetical protein
MLSPALMALLGNLTLPTWLREILVSVGVAARTITVFAAAVALGILVAIKSSYLTSLRRRLTTGAAVAIPWGETLPDEGLLVAGSHPLPTT